MPRPAAERQESKPICHHSQTLNADNTLSQRSRGWGGWGGRAAIRCRSRLPNASRLAGIFRRADPQPDTRDVFAPPAYGLFDLHAETGIDDIPKIRSVHIAARREVRTRESSRPILKEDLAAIRRLFDWLTALWVVSASSAGDPGSECRRSE